MCVSQPAHRNPKTRISLKPGTFSNARLSCSLGKKKAEKRTEFSRKKSILSFICLSLTKNSRCGLGFLDLKLDTAKEMCADIPIRPRNETLEVRFHLTSADAALFILLNATAAVRRRKALSSYNTFNITAHVCWAHANIASGRQHIGKERLKQNYICMNVILENYYFMILHLLAVWDIITAPVKFFKMEMIC